MTQTSTGRLNVRLTPEQEQALRHAEAVTGQSLTGFVLSSAVEHAHEVLARANTVETPLDDWLRRTAAIAAAAGAAATWVLCRGQVVVGYDALAMGSLARAGTPSRLGRAASGRWVPGHEPDRRSWTFGTVARERARFGPGSLQRARVRADR
jgi:uncharacterized protein (DUF1778 family)